MKKKKDKGITIKYDAGDVESNIAFFNNAMGSNVGGDSNSQGGVSTGVGESLNEEMEHIYYHGSLTLFKEFKSNITNWLADDIDYSLIYASWGSRNGYIYYCRVDDLNLYDCGYTGTRVYSLMPIKPYKKTDAMLKILNGLNLNEKEQNDLLKEVAIEYNEWERLEGYNLRIDVVTRSDAFRKLLKSKGYDGVKAQERNQNTNKLCNTLGIFKASAIHIEKIDEVVKTGSGIELLPLEEELVTIKESENRKMNQISLNELVDKMVKITNRTTWIDKPLGRERATGDEIHLYYFNKDNYIYFNLTKNKVYAYVLDGEPVRLKESLKESEDNKVYGLFAYSHKLGNTKAEKVNDGNPIESGTRAEMEKAKKDYLASWNENNLDITYTFLIKEIKG